MSASQKWEAADPTREDRAIIGYFAGVAAGAISFWFVGFSVVLTIALVRGDQVFRETGQQAINAAAAIGIFSLVCFIIGCVITVPPFLITRWIARRLQISSVAYYMGCGFVAGLLFFSLHMALSGLVPRDPGDPTWTDLIVGVLDYAFSGAIGSFVFWRIAVRT